MEGIVKSGTHRHECVKLCASAVTDSQDLCASMRKNVSGTLHASTGYMHQNKLHVINKWNIFSEVKKNERKGHGHVVLGSFILIMMVLLATIIVIVIVCW